LSPLFHFQLDNIIFYFCPKGDTEIAEREQRRTNVLLQTVSYKELRLQNKNCKLILTRVYIEKVERKKKVKKYSFIL